MLTLPSSVQVYLACGSTDLRKSIDGLDPFAPSLFAFCNRDRNKLKILYWEHNDFWLFYRRLERGTFHWPNKNSEPVTITSREFRWLLDGLSLSQRQAHPKVTS
ncbi:MULTISPECIES: IS66 family insertion sequence element accessory protein TnpB [Paenibacillus]|uniref:Transposase n=1 Tax=Paenibacillus aceti TaxID=1820010 RepID=A0ABQ1W8X2_9BACL|nr:transposase [Paenibacillus aceti]